jgi:hypothetical protein
MADDTIRVHDLRRSPSVTKDRPPMIRFTLALALSAVLVLGGCFKSDNDARDELNAQRERTDASMKEVAPVFVEATGGRLSGAQGGFTTCRTSPAIATTYRGTATIPDVTVSVDELDRALTDAGWEHVDVDDRSPLFDSWDIKKGDRVVGVTYRLENSDVSFGVSNDCVDVGDQDLQDEFTRQAPTTYAGK